MFEGKNGCDEIEFPQKEEEDHQADREEIEFRSHGRRGELGGKDLGTRGNSFFI